MMITASDKAVEHLKDGLVEKCFNVGLGYRFTRTAGDGEKIVFSLKLDNVHPDDEVIVAQGIRIIIGPSEAKGLHDAVLDYLEEPDGGFCLKENNVGTNSEKQKVD